MSISARVENDPGSRIPSHFSPIMREFFIGVFLGNVAQFDENQIEDLVNGYFPTIPLIPISSAREAALRGDIKEFCQTTFRHRDIYQILAGKIVFVAQAANYLETQNWEALKDTPLFVTGRWAEKLHRKYGLPYLDPSEKERLLTDPQIWLDARLIMTTQAGKPCNNILVYWGTRQLYGEYGYGYKDLEEYKEVLDAARNAQGKKPTDELLILDIGGSNGLAAYDMEQVDPNSIVTNLTIEPQLGVFPLKGGHLLGLAERLPEDFRNEFDIILSHMAFTYMRYPHIALINALYALRVGGVMDISFGWERYGIKDGSRQMYMLDREVKPVFEWIEDLEKKGVIEYMPRYKVTSSRLINRVYPPQGRVNLIIKKTIEPEALQSLDKILTAY